MNYFTSQRLKNYLIVFLILLNLGQIGLLFLSKIDGPPEAIRLFGLRNTFGKILQAELGIDEQKADEIEALTRENHKDLRPIIRMHDELTDSLIQLIKAPNDSIAKDLARNIGTTQEAMEYKTYLYFVDARNRLEHKDKLVFDNLLEKIGKRRFIAGPPQNPRHKDEHEHEKEPRH